MAALKLPGSGINGSPFLRSTTRGQIEIWSRTEGFQPISEVLSLRLLRDAPGNRGQDSPTERLQVHIDTPVGFLGQLPGGLQYGIKPVPKDLHAIQIPVHVSASQGDVVWRILQ